MRSPEANLGKMLALRRRYEPSLRDLPGRAEAKVSKHIALPRWYYQVIRQV